MNGMQGADVAELRALAQQFDGAAQRLDAGRGAVGHAIQIRAWFGPAAVQFRHEWDSQHSRSIHVVAERLRDAARTLRANADDQERTSAAGGGSTATGGGPAVGHGSASSGGTSRFTAEQAADYEQLLETIKLVDTVHGTAEDAADLLAALKDGSIDAKSFSQWASDVKGLDAGTLLDLAGMAITAKELGEALGTDDPATTLEASLDLIMGAAGVKAPHVGLAWDIGKFLGESGYNSLQAFYDSPSSALDFAARQMYGSSATFDGLEQYQRDALMTRYEGMGGLLVSLVDHGAGAVEDFRTWVRTGTGRGPR